MADSLGQTDLSTVASLRFRGLLSLCKDSTRSFELVNLV